MGCGRLLQGLALASGLVSALPSSGPHIEKRAPSVNITYLGLTTSNFPNIYRDGGGGGTINGLNFLWFSDGLYTSGGVPKADNSNLVNFSSNSIACSNCDGKGVASLQDFGTSAKGPEQQIPYFYGNGESDGATGIWPNQNFVTLCNGACGVGFPIVIDRDLVGQNLDGDLYNTGVHIELTGYGPVVTRPTKALFVKGEPFFGSFCSLAGIDGYIYMFARTTELAAGRNGLKLARVPNTLWSDRGSYQYWNGNSFGSVMPAYDDGGSANVFSWDDNVFGTYYGPGTGDIWWSPSNNCYIMVFQASVGIDASVYMSYSSSMTGGWSTPVVIYSLTKDTVDDYSYAFHALPTFDITEKSIPFMWTAFSSPATFKIGMAMAHFS